MANVSELKTKLDKKGFFLSQFYNVDRFLCAAIAHKLGVTPFHFVKRQACYLLLGLAAASFITLMSPKFVKRFAIFGFFLSVLALVWVLFKGYEVKGARRWLHWGLLSIQPSEFAKTFFTVFTAWILSIRYKHQDFPSFVVSLVPYLVVVTLLILQPDFGMVVMLSIVWIGELFIGGLSIFWLSVMACISVLGILSSYLLIPHVRTRIDLFLDPQNFENYQIRKAIEAFRKGGVTGVGLGEGAVKHHIPDSHTDFVYAVIGEEMGFIACLFLAVMFLLLIFRGLYLALVDRDKFNVLAASGILIQIGMQTVFNIGITLHLFPTKGMTLPLISYGGSSLIATAISLGMLLALTKKTNNIAS
jgi:cell division protein FtsW